MPHRQHLTPEDDLFGRVALFNSLATLDQIVECARCIAAELVAGRPRRSLATMLILKGYVTASAAGAVEAAIRRKHAPPAAGPAAGGSAAPTRKLAPMQSHAPSGASQISVAVPDPAAAARAAAGREDQLRAIVSRLAPGRIYPEMLAYIDSHRVTIMDPKGMARAIGEPEPVVAAALRHWSKAGVLKTVGTQAYSFSPGAREEREIKLFLEAWRDPELHAHVLGYILAVE